MQMFLGVVNIDPDESLNNKRHDKMLLVIALILAAFLPLIKTLPKRGAEVKYEQQKPGHFFCCAAL